LKAASSAASYLCSAFEYAPPYLHTSLIKIPRSCLHIYSE
jgi:hypothetical protein